MSHTDEMSRFLLEETCVAGPVKNTEIIKLADAYLIAFAYTMKGVSFDSLHPFQKVSQFVFR